ncbi:hypothetical protein [Acinetobacter guillouiae]|uniref:hypothetical protein n=1 Tax=Acinetobacter guillouiae TaxID=106649 RepID=UPI001AE54E85|nr:hypothetical protein [Acinetobacter guillouiae]MBP2546865.1 hypothetical protein [Acinetobacter guillouiae]
MKNNGLPFELSVKVSTNRPDFRVFASFLFASNTHNYDSDGDSYPLTSRHWTELYISSREIDNYTFSISPLQNDPLILQIQTSQKSICYAIAYFLAIETQGSVFNNQGIPLSSQHIENKLKNFPLTEHLAFANESVWRNSSEDNPYPNLN